MLKLVSVVYKERKLDRWMTIVQYLNNAMFDDHRNGQFDKGIIRKMAYFPVIPL